MVSAFITKDGEKNPKSVHLLLSALRRPRAGLPDRSSWRGFPARRTVATCLSAAQTSGIVWCATVWPWTGRNIQNESTMMCSVRPSRLGAGCGQAATSSRGFTGYAFGRAVVRPIARMMRTLTPEHAYRRPQLTLTLIMCTGGAYRPFLHDRHFSA
jgi:hypothetical protein